MNLSAALSILAKAGYVSPSSEHYDSERQLVARAIEAAVKASDPGTVLEAMTWAGLPHTDHDQLRFAAALGFIVGAMLDDASVPRVDEIPPLSADGLLPCPFCSGAAHLAGSGGRFYGACSNPACGASTMSYDTVSAAQACWNARSELAPRNFVA